MDNTADVAALLLAPREQYICAGEGRGRRGGGGRQRVYSENIETGGGVGKGNGMNKGRLLFGFRSRITIE